MSVFYVSFNDEKNLFLDAHNCLFSLSYCTYSTFRASNFNYHKVLQILQDLKHLLLRKLTFQCMHLLVKEEEKNSSSPNMPRCTCLPLKSCLLSILSIFIAQIVFCCLSRVFIDGHGIVTDMELLLHRDRKGGDPDAFV